MKALLERLAPYLDQQEADYPPGLCCAVKQASGDGVLSATEKMNILFAVWEDQDANGWQTFRVRTFAGTQEERTRQWREWAESLLQSVDK